MIKRKVKSNIFVASPMRSKWRRASRFSEYFLRAPEGTQRRWRRTCVRAGRGERRSAHAGQRAESVVGGIAARGHNPRHAEHVNVAECARPGVVIRRDRSPPAMPCRRPRPRLRREPRARPEPRSLHLPERGHSRQRRARAEESRWSRWSRRRFSGGAAVCCSGHDECVRARPTRLPPSQRGARGGRPRGPHRRRAHERRVCRLALPARRR